MHSVKRKEALVMVSGLARTGNGKATLATAAPSDVRRGSASPLG